ncbi:hypothetical protein OJ998_25820 [Solirubrobacter taibaiensis]|nr:hypothetical protein [Solirubrobacter taibaiensis]
MSKRRRRGPWFEDTALNLFTLAWLCRAVWRVWRGRAPWQSVRRV